MPTPLKKNPRKHKNDVGNKNVVIKKRSSNKNNKNNKNKHNSILQNIKYFQKIIQNTIKSAKKYKSVDILGISEFNACIINLEKIFEELRVYKNVLITKDKKKIEYDVILDHMGQVKNELITIFKNFGTYYLDDLINLMFGNEYLKSVINEGNKDIYELLKHYSHPINFKIMPRSTLLQQKKKRIVKGKIVEDFMIADRSETFECFDLSRRGGSFHTKVYGIKISLQDRKEQKTVIVAALVDDLILKCLDHPFVKNKKASLMQSAPDDPDFQGADFKRFINILTLKELIVYNNEELQNRFVGYLNQCSMIKSKEISVVIKDFIHCELFGQRTTLIQLLMKKDNPEYQYLAYLLYELFSSDLSDGNNAKTLLFDSFPWEIKKYFRDAIINTKRYTRNLSNFDDTKIPLEQQICLMKVKDSIKQKAIAKLKQIRAKSEDSGSKARQWLDGLLKIPFNILKKEPILHIKDEILIDFNNLIKEVSDFQESENIVVSSNSSGAKNNKKKSTKKSKEDSVENEIRNELDNLIQYIASKKDCKYNNMLIKKSCNEISNRMKNRVDVQNRDIIVSKYTFGKRVTLVDNIMYINEFIKDNKAKYPNLVKITHYRSGKNALKEQIKNFIENNFENEEFMDYLKKRYISIIKHYGKTEIITKHLDKINEKWNKVDKYIDEVKENLDNAIYGHDLAKRQIERIVGQWINGEHQGYCFGFEGPPGVGKTSLAKYGLAKCLKDAEGNCRPFAFIALGGSTNGSTLVGHNYTYVGSQWGRIVDILISKKCMNPIIYIDELDKVSRTERGKEIIGILTHLIDTTQNENFQDKYFQGIDLNLSKALFIFSYNDVNAIDRVLLDRIHRVKFKHLSLEEKLVIVNRHLLPEIYKKTGIDNMITFSDDIIKFIIRTYTRESGVRKLKEILFEIVGEVNLEFLQSDGNFKIPIVITEKAITEKYLKDRHQVMEKKIHDSPSVGIICGLWANALGMGGMLPIEGKFYPHSTFMELKLTGMQGDVMKESMNVAKTLAWQLTTSEMREKIVKRLNDPAIKMSNGIHIHCPEGATPKDGPSAGTAITSLIYSLLNNKKIRNDIAITGEITLQGKVTAIGGLDLKILGGIRSGVKEFLFPKENEKDFNKFMDKYKDKEIIKDVKFNMVEKITDVFKIIFV